MKIAAAAGNGVRSFLNGKALLWALLTALVFGFALAQAGNAAAAAGDIGFEGRSTVGAGSAPTGEKPESKLWWNDGFWWASMWDAGSADFHVFRLNTATQSWVDTGVAIDDRSGTKADTLWDATSGKLYVASHVFSGTSASGTPGRLYRYSYNTSANTYALDSGFPVAINNFKTESLVIAKDSTGQLWATWKQGGSVVVNSTVCTPVCNDAQWGAAFTPSVPGTSISSDDISSVIAFGGNKIGVYWSNQSQDADYFAVHSDSQPDSTWSGETAYSGPGFADDHMNLKTDSAGRLYVAAKTSLGGSTDPLDILLVRSAAGAWSSNVFSLKSDHHTRPIVEIDETAGRLHMFATSPESAGVIYEKTSPLGSISFTAGLGTPVLKDADGKLNNVSSTKQNVTPAMGLVLLASSSNSVYFHQFISLGSGGGSPPSAAFSATPTSGTAPLTVSFTDQSSGAPTSWAWDFQNDGIVDSNQQNPTFEYAAAGTYSVKLTVGNGAGSDALTKNGYVTVSPGGGGGGALTFTPTDDAYVRSNAVTENTGSATTLRAYKSGTTSTDSYLKFTVGGVSGAVSSAKLRLWVNNASPNGGDLTTSATNWSEGGLTWSTRPTTGTAVIASTGTVATGQWVELDVGSVVAGNGTYSFALKGASADVAMYDSSEAANKPQLVVATGGGGGGGTAPTAAFSGTPTSGTAPLTVAFTDESTGSPNSWAWDFQNDGQTDSNVQNPSFEYTAPGTYSVKLIVGNDVASDPLVKTGYVTVSSGGGGGGSTATFTPTDDSYVRSNAPAEQNGGALTLRTYKSGSTLTDSYLKFTVAGLTGTVSSVKLRVWVNDASPNGGDLFPVADTTWSEDTLSWDTRPAPGPNPLASAGAVSAGTWLELDLGAGAVTGNDMWSFVLRGASSDVARYDSSEATRKPELVVTTT